MLIITRLASLGSVSKRGGVEKGEVTRGVIKDVIDGMGLEEAVRVGVECVRCGNKIGDGDDDDDDDDELQGLQGLVIFRDDDNQLHQLHLSATELLEFKL